MERISARGHAAASTRRRVVRPLGLLWVAAGGVALTVGSSLVAAGGGVPGWERAVFRAVNGLPDWLYRPMWAVQLLGVLVVPIVFAVAAVIARRWRLALALLALPPLKLAVEFRVLKALVERGRPGENEPGAVLRDVPPAGLSFPSGHVIIAFGIAMLLAPYLSRRAKVVAFAIAALVGVARTYLGAHNPLDVVAGAGAGLALGALLTLVVGIRRR